MLDISRRFIRDLNEKNVRYVIFKGSNHFEEGFNGTGDVDLLVHADDREIIHEIFASLEFINPDTQKYSKRDFIEDFIGFDRKTGKLIHIHLYFNVAFGNSFVNEYSFNLYDICFENYIVVDECKLINPCIEMLILMCRVYTGDMVKSEKIKKNIVFLREKFSDENFISVCGECKISEKDSRLLLDSIKNNNFDFSVSREIVKNLFSENIRYKFFITFIRKNTYRLYRKISGKSVYAFIKKPLKNGGIKIAFLGQDGAGKTTVTNDITKWLRFKLEAKNFYLGSGDNFFSFEKKLMKKLPKEKNAVQKLIAAVLSVMYQKKNSTYTLQSIVKAEKYAGNGGIAVFDRYPQTDFPGINDSAKIRENYIPKVNNVLLKKLLLVFAVKEEKNLKKAVEYSPDTVIKLMLSPEESIKRKPGENYEAVKRKHEIIKQLNFNKSNVYSVDVTRSYEDEIIEIKNIIWDNILK